LLDRTAPLESRRDLGRRDAGTAAVREPEVSLAERHGPRRIANVEMPGALPQGEHDPQGILDYDAIPQDDRRERRRRHPVSLADPLSTD
jgi:hypothetical protein